MPLTTVKGSSSSARPIDFRLCCALAILFAIVALALAIWPLVGESLLSTTFVPRLYVYAGHRVVLWVHVIADSLISVSFLAISAALVYLVYKARRTIPFEYLVLAFGAFLIASALTHFFSVLTTWFPMYVFSGGVKIIAALAATATAILLPFVVPRILKVASTASTSHLIHERLRLAMESGKTVGWEWDLISRHNYMFGDLRTMFGMFSNAHSGPVDDFSGRIHPEDRDRVHRVVEDAQASKGPYSAEFRVVRVDGSVRWVAARGEFEYGPDGRAQRMRGMAVDITDRKSAEESARQRQQELFEAQRLAGLGSWSWDPETDTVQWSEELYRLAGRDPKLPAVSYEDHPTLYTHESWNRLSARVEEALRSGTPYELDLEMIRPDGTTRWLTARGEARCDASGKVIGLRGTVLDITQRKRAQDSLTLFRKLIDGSNDAIEVIDPKTLRFIDVNEKGCRDLGYTREEFLALKINDLDPSMNDTGLAKLRSTLEQSGRAIFESRYRRKDGSTLPVEVNLRSITLDRQYALAIVRDISERRKAQEELRESEQLLRLAVEAGRMFAYSWDANTDSIVRSGESAEILGIKNDSPFTGSEMLARVHPEDTERLKAAIAALTPERPYLQVAYRMIRPDHKVIWLERNSCAHFDEHGELRRIVGMVADITNRKLAEEALMTVSRRLIEAQESERSRIARELHDDIGQRIALLSVTIERAREALVAADAPAEVHNYVEQLRSGMGEIAGGLQALSHQLHSSSLDHLGMVAAMRGWCTELSLQHHVEIDFKHRQIPRDVPSDVALCLFRVMQEGLRNAMKYSRVRRFEVEVSGAAGRVELILRDQGVGFDVEAATRGTGLGLTSMRERLKLVSGEILIRSVPNQGTTIYARAPLPALRDQLLPAAG